MLQSWILWRMMAEKWTSLSKASPTLWRPLSWMRWILLTTEYLFMKPESHHERCHEWPYIIGRDYKPWWDGVLNEFLVDVNASINKDEEEHLKESKLDIVGSVVMWLLSTLTYQENGYIFTSKLSISLQIKPNLCISTSNIIRNWIHDKHCLGSLRIHSSTLGVRKPLAKKPPKSYTQHYVLFFLSDLKNFNGF